MTSLQAFRAAKKAAKTARAAGLCPTAQDSAARAVLLKNRPELAGKFALLADLANECVKASHY